MDIRFYDLQGKLKLSCNDYIRVLWQECLVDVAEIEITLLQNHPALDLLIKERNLIAEYDGKKALVTDYNIENGLGYLKANSFNVLLSNRIVPSDTYMFYGTPETAIVDCIKQYAPFISLPEEFLLSQEKQIFVKKPTLFSVVKNGLSNTERGLRVGVSLKNCSYFLEFINPQTKYLRLSTGNRNIRNLLCERNCKDIKNAGYYTLYFEDGGTWGSGLSTATGLTNYDPENYMKQFVAISDGRLGDLYVKMGQYIYCDTLDGKLKTSDVKQETRVGYMTVEENPVLIKEVDLRYLKNQEASFYLEQASKVKEIIEAVPNNIDVEIGEIIFLEKCVGEEKGLIKMQVTSIKTDSKSPLTEIKLEVR